jgi:hypothetical protein
MQELCGKDSQEEMDVRFLELVVSVNSGKVKFRVQLLQCLLVACFKISSSLDWAVALLLYMLHCKLHVAVGVVVVQRAPCQQCTLLCLDSGARALQSRGHLETQARL